jgi:GDP/UDP-N,N'-diacetylbacillosamine 2-epimerase (hydrolysing)
MDPSLGGTPASPTASHPALKWRIAVFTGNRADASLLIPVAHALVKDPRFDPVHSAWWVGGDHLAQGSITELEADGLLPLIVMPIDPTLYGENQTAKRMSHSTQAHLRAVQALLATTQTPAAVIVLGDRFEAFAVALACFYHGIPILHLAGGDWTEGGCVDDRLRFMISELATLHCCFSATSAQRLEKRGYDQVFVTGSTVVDTIQALALTPPSALFEGLSLDPGRPLWLATQHPVGLNQADQSLADLEALITALSASGHQVVWTAPNRDGVGEAMQARILAAVAQQAQWRYQDTLGRVGYLSWLAACHGVIGNTSSGLLETAYFAKPSVTVGKRQAGRERGANVITVEHATASAIASAMETALHDKTFQASMVSGGSVDTLVAAGPQVLTHLADYLNSQATPNRS